MITENTQLPEKMDKFWPLSDNKVKMQRFSKSCLLYLAKQLNRPLIVSGTVDGEDSIPAQHLNNAMGIDEILKYWSFNNHLKRQIWMSSNFYGILSL